MNASDDDLTWVAGSVVLSDNPPQQLKFWRKKFGIKQADLARKMSLTPSVLSDYEKGRRPSPGAKFIKRYLLALYELAKSNGKPAEQVAPSPVASAHIKQPWQGSYMPLIVVSMYPGRTKEQKDEFAKAITDATVQIMKTKSEHVIVVFDEKPKENWFQSGKPL